MDIRPSQSWFLAVVAIIFQNIHQRLVKDLYFMVTSFKE